MSANACVPSGTPFQASGGEMLSPSQVYLVGMAAPPAKALLDRERPRVRRLLFRRAAATGEQEDAHAKAGDRYRDVPGLHLAYCTCPFARCQRIFHRPEMRDASPAVRYMLS